MKGMIKQDQILDGGVWGVPNPHIPTFFHSISPKPHQIFVNIPIYGKFPNPQSPPKMFQSPDFSEPIF